MNKQDAIIKLYETQTQIEHFHRNTVNPWEHKALGEFYESFADLKDEFIESLSGKHGLINISFYFAILPYNPGKPLEFLKELQSILTASNKTGFREDIFEDTELCNIVDDMLSLTNKTIYLLNQNQLV